MPSPGDLLTIPFSDWINFLVRDWLVPNFRPFFRSLQWPITQVLNSLDALLQATPMLLFTALLAFVAWRTAGRGVAILSPVNNSQRAGIARFSAALEVSCFARL